ncbi:MAG: DNA polymerase I, partial [Promicromonosporaceae bacterium]|nr:DNA polymerase I [Promicromonosporaceae bacterium]
AWTLAAARGDQAIVIDLQALSVDDDVALGEWLGDESTPKTLHGAKAAWHALKGRGYDLRGLAFDTELAAYLCYPDQRGYALGDLAVRHLGLDLSPDESGAQGALDLDGLGDNDATEQALTAVAIGRLAEVFTGELRDRAALGLLNELELPLTNVLAQMEHSGIAVDLDHLADLTKGFSAQVTAAAAEAYAAIGREVNLASPKQLQDVLFDQLGLPKTKKTKTGYTTDAAALQELFAKQPHPFLEALLAHREAAKLRATVEGLERSTLAGRIHTTFQQTVAATGRLSSTEPNLQNIPIRTEVGREIRKSFVVGAGFETLLTADYSQIEMRIMAHLSEDPGLIEAFEQGEDLHRYVGSRVFGVEPQDVGAEMRSKVKAMSYGLAYGLSAFGLSQQLGISPPEAQTLMDDYFTRFGHVHDYLQQVVAQARLSGYTETLLGRRRYLPDLNSENRQRRQMAERVATNAPIQGSAADLIKLAMLGVQREFTSAALGSRLLLQVHDELVVEVAPGELETVRQVVSTQMAGAYRLRVPLDVSVGIGRNWHAAAH